MCEEVDLYKIAIIKGFMFKKKKKKKQTEIMILSSLILLSGFWKCSPLTCTWTQQNATGYFENISSELIILNYV